MLSSADAHSPKYARIADSIRQRIARGHWPASSRVPTNEALAEEFGVSRVTVRQAVDILVREGLLDARQGLGTFVTRTPAEDRWLKVETSLAALAEVYRDSSPEILNIAESSAEPSLTRADGSAAERYVYMRRVHSRDGQPYCVISIYLDEAVFHQHPERFRSEVVIPILVKMRHPAVKRAHQTFTIGSADLEVSQLLGIPLSSPVAEVRRVFTTARDRVIYLGEVTYRGDSVRIEMDLKP